jgi:hypothetical protein
MYRFTPARARLPGARLKVSPKESLDPPGSRLALNRDVKQCLSPAALRFVGLRSKVREPREVAIPIAREPARDIGRIPRFPYLTWNPSWINRRRRFERRIVSLSLLRRE